MAYLLDTNHCSRIIAGDPVLIQQLREHRSQNITTSVIVRGELYFMVYKSKRQAENLRAVNALLERMVIYPIDTGIADRYGQLKGEIINRLGPKERAKRRKVTIQGLGFSDNDLWIAATALQYPLTLVSADQDFQRLQSVCSLAVESWL